MAFADGCLLTMYLCLGWLGCWAKRCFSIFVGQLFVFTHVYSLWRTIPVGAKVSPS